MAKHTLHRRPSTPSGPSCAAVLATVAALTPAVSVLAADANWEPLSEGKNHFTLGASFGFNLKANFKELHGPPPATPYGPAVGGVLDRSYDDGFLGVDSAGNVGGQTGYYQYGTLGQATAGTLDFHSAVQAVSGGSASDREGVAPGVELTYSRDLLKWGRTTWGLEGGFGFTSASFDAGYTDALSLLTDSYVNPFGLGLPGLVAPNTPVARDTPGRPLMPDAPTRGITPGAGGTRSGSLALESDLFTFRLGPCVTIPINQRFAAHLGAGLAVVFVNSDFKFAETVAATTLAGTTSRSLSTSDTDVAVGGYVGGTLSYSFTKAVGAFAGARFQAAGNVTQDLAGRQAELDLGSTVFTQAGVRLSF